jgi:hypothetical protein
MADAIAGAELPAEAGAAMQRACDRASENLRRSVGEDGYNALLARVLRATEALHPALLAIRRVGDDGIRMDGIVATVETHGLPAVTLALEEFFTALIDILSGLIGADMVPNLLGLDGPASQPNAGRQTK